MYFQEFCDKVRCSMQEYLGQTSKVLVETITKNNGIKLTGLIAQTKENEAVPTIYLEEYYEQYAAGCGYSEVMRRIIEFYDHYSGMQVDLGYFSDYQKMKGRILCKLIHYGRNRELLEEVPYVPWQDLAIVFFHMLVSDAVGSAAILIRNSHLDLWKVTREQLYEDAMKNTPRLMEDELIPMNELLSQMAPGELQDKVLQQDIPMYVLTNKWKQFGAICMLYSEKIKNLSDSIQCSLFIMPSSVHEVILLPDSGHEEVSFMRQIVKEVNHTQVAEEEVLSDAVYYYDRTTAKIALCS